MIGRIRFGVSTKHMVQIQVFVFTMLFFTSAFSQTDAIQDIRTVIFRDGTAIQGQVVQMNINTITIWTPDDDIIIRKFDDVERLVKKDIFDIEKGSTRGPDKATGR